MGSGTGSGGGGFGGVPALKNQKGRRDYPAASVERNRFGVCLVRSLLRPAGGGVCHRNVPLGGTVAHLGIGPTEERGGRGHRAVQTGGAGEVGALRAVHRCLPSEVVRGRVPFGTTNTKPSACGVVN